MTVISLLEEERVQLEKTPFIDINKEWKYMRPFFYKSKCGYYEVYTSEEREKYLFEQEQEKKRR